MNVLTSWCWNSFSAAKLHAVPALLPSSVESVECLRLSSYSWPFGHAFMERIPDREEQSLTAARFLSTSARYLTPDEKERQRFCFAKLRC